MPLPTPQRPFDVLAHELALEQLAASPTLASSLGLTDYDALLPDMSAQAVADREARDDAWLVRLDALDDDGLDPDERVDRDLVSMVLRGRAVMRDWQGWRRSADLYAGTALAGVFGLLLHRLTGPRALAESVAARLDAAPALLAQGVENLDPTLADPVLLRRALGQVTAGAAYARSVVAQLDPAEAARAGVEAAGERAALAFEGFGAHVADLAEHATGQWAIGEERYDALLRHAEGLSYGAREMRERGRVAYDELLDDIRARTARVRGHGDGSDWRDLLEELNADHAATPEELLEDYRAATARARAFCAEHELVTLPDGERCEVVPSAPFTRPMLAVAHYMQPPPLAGGGVGHFFVPYPPEGASAEQVAQRLSSNNRHTLWSVTVHEAYPGHHWHFSWIASGRAPGGARLLRTLFGSTYVVEGWGLYCEELMREQGFFTSARQELSQREMRLFRAARIVVDTSLHLGDMDVEEAVTHMSTRTSLSAETARAEVLRYCAWPTQAASYLTGALEIARLRERWLAEGRGPLRAFHDAAAGSGRLPVCLMERSVFGAPAAAAAAGRVVGDE